MRAFHSNWTRPFLARNGADAVYTVPPFELLTTALSALTWRWENGSIAMLCDNTAKDYYTSLGLTFLWDDGIHAVLEDIPREIDATCFWAAGKLYALQHFGAPCVMIDTDFIVWRNLSDRLDGHKLMTIHSEDIMPDIYPGPEAFTLHKPFDLASLDWTVRPANTALSYFGDRAFTEQYVQTAIDFMQAASPADNGLTYMVFAEQRLLAMLAARAHVPLDFFMDLPELFLSGQTWFTHVWGFKQQMLADRTQYDGFCTRCAKRLMRDFPDAALALQQVPALAPYFDVPLL